MRILAIAVVALHAADACPSRPTNGADPDPIRVAMFRLQPGAKEPCYAVEFLTLAAEASGRPIEPSLTRITIGSSAMREHAVAVMTGEGVVSLSPEQGAALRAWFDAGGFLIASAACGSRDWAMSMERELLAAVPGSVATTLPADDPILHLPYDIGDLTRLDPAPADRPAPDAPPGPPTLRVLRIDGRPAAILSADGLNDAPSVDPSCCCCGDSGLRDAPRLGANILLSALR